MVEKQVCYLRIRQNGKQKYEQFGENVSATVCLQIGRLLSKNL